ncbi:glutathione-regulated potassium-efflux system protein KefC [Cupriavidus plantarum]|uniref:Kef-type potassium/proton antiporter (CPA2 family) n=1 Tax=Cupriavidus plantarum TaxID=942865 RepID=A0A316F563_9BURK|nr:glutathione-regulated potassium-efflux system protein KefC [Cupriavidus plantarum]NYH97237.1 glutathione-regulated potassium-efflux system ancillary protein KefC [Cupriavidus plantarum]PWK31873.1 Kef-type potassium/proton antiporter (CPA2 family) [Cupriavidus plantarum]RLK29202.1 Kef-type potassium/proton antiporter (CPA2 family) [Cupriavidus plantarum]
MNQHDFLIALLVFLVAAVVAVPLARRFGLGAVLGYLIAGAAIGPHALRLVTNVESILHFSEFGVVMMLFVIGLELEPKKLRALKQTIFRYGSMQLAACALALGGIAALLGASWQVALVAGLGLALSSTAIAFATLAERNLMSTPAGAASFGILLFQDIAAIPMIALLPLLAIDASDALHHTGAPHWQTAAKAVAVMGAVVVGGRYLVRPALRFIARTDMREMFTAFALLLVIGIALMMDAVGLSMALGTFVAGVLLADSEYRHALEADIEPFKGLLLGLFFMAVGMSIDFGIFAQSPLQVTGLVLGFVLVKTAVLMLLARRFAIARGQRMLFALLISQGGEFAFVVFSVAGGAGLLPERTEALLVLMVALSMVATPLLLLLFDRFVAPGLNASGRPDDVIPPQHDPVIIAGFGRFGQIIGRLLYAQGIGVTVLDHDPDQIEFLREFGFNVYYGDATRVDLLEAAGAGRAKILVVALDGMEDSLALIDRVRERWPDLKIYARARHVSHVYQLKDRGVETWERELFEGSLMMGRRVLEGLGFDPSDARNVALRFRRHNKAAIDRFYPHYTDQKKLVSLARQARDELEEMFRQDREQRQKNQDAEWS